MDGSKTFVATAADQQSLMAFAFNAMMGTSLFGAIAVAREYGHHTVVPMFLTSPNRHSSRDRPADRGPGGRSRAGLPRASAGRRWVALALPSTEHGFLVSAGDLARSAATTLAGAIGATLGAGLGALIRNVGGAVTTAVLVLFVIPPLAVQLFSDVGSWIPTSVCRALRSQPRREPMGRSARHRRLGTRPRSRRTRSRQSARRGVAALLGGVTTPVLHPRP